MLRDRHEYVGYFGRQNQLNWTDELRCIDEVKRMQYKHLSMLGVVGVNVASFPILFLGLHLFGNLIFYA